MADLELSPLAGKRIVITRAFAQSEGLFDALRDCGAEPVLFPLIRISAIADYSALDAAMGRLKSGDWIIFTSQNAVAPVAQRGRILRDDFFSAARGLQIAAVGPATEKAARAAGLNVGCVAKVHDGVSLAHELGARLAGKQALLPRSDLASSALPAAIQKFGGKVVEVVAYRTEHMRVENDELVKMVEIGVVDAIVFYSPSAVHAFVDLLASKNIENLHNKVVLAAIGAVTAQALREVGARKFVVAMEATTAAVVKALSDHFAGLPHGQLAGMKNL